MIQTQLQLQPDNILTSGGYNWACGVPSKTKTQAQRDAVSLRFSMVIMAAMGRMNMPVMGIGAIRIYIDDNMAIIAICLMRLGIPIL